MKIDFSLSYHLDRNILLMWNFNIIRVMYMGILVHGSHEMLCAKILHGLVFHPNYKKAHR